MLVDIIVNQISAEDFSVPEVKDINLPFSKVTPTVKILNIGTCMSEQTV